MPAEIIVLVLLSDLPFSFGKSGNDIIVVHDQGFTLCYLIVLSIQDLVMGKHSTFYEH